jgi:hypothetical protein
MQPNIQQPPQYPQPQYQPQPYLEYKNAALWCIIGAWVLGFMGSLLCLTVIGALLGIPMIVAAFTLHIIGIVLIAMIRVR